MCPMCSGTLFRHSGSSFQENVQEHSVCDESAYDQHGDCFQNFRRAVYGQLQL